MKKLFTCAIALGMAASMPALADDHHEQGGGHPGGAPGGGQHGPAMAAEHGPAGGGHPMAMSHAAPMAQQHQQTFSHASAPTQRETVAPRTEAETHHFSAPEQHHANSAAPAFTHNAERNGGEHNGAEHNAGHAAAFNAPHHDARATHHFHDGGYNPPQGYHHQHWRHGEHLPDGYYARDYWIDNYVDFGLYAPPPDYVWVRVGDDAVLIDQDDGSIVQVEYGIFY